MFRIALPSDETYLLLTPRFADLEGQWALLGLCLFVPVVIVLGLYRYELHLLPRLAAVALLGLRILVLLILWFVTGLQPSVARFHEEEVPSRVLVAIDFSPSMEVRDVQRSAEEKQTLMQTLALTDEAAVDSLSRRQIVELLLREKDLIKRLAANHQVDIVGFDRTLWEGAAPTWHELFAAAAAGVPPQPKGQGEKITTHASDLRLPLRRGLEAASRDQGKLLGVVLFSDGQHNASSEGQLFKEAEGLGRRAEPVPVFPVALGAKDPPVDLAVLEVQSPANAFKNTDVAIEARVRINGLAAQTIVVELTEPGKTAKPEHRRTIQHDGKDRVLTLPFQWKSESAGVFALEVKAKPADVVREITADNNALTTVVRIADDKARVLVIDDEARWEYHYLAAALARDPYVRPDFVLFTQPRIDKTPEDKLEKLGHPKTSLPPLPSLLDKGKPGAEDPLDRYDCIFLGDVPPAKLSSEDRRRLERYVAERGGALVFMAGKRHLPAEYVAAPDVDADPLVKMLPVALTHALKPEEGFALKLTAEGSLAPIMQMEETAKDNPKRWSEFPRHYWGLAGRPKPAAAALAFADDPATSKPSKDPPEKRNALLVQQPYGFGQVLYVGIDSTWRWRYRTGDMYHHRFWGQIVRWAAIDKLLPGGNRYVRFGSRQPVVRHGQPAEIAVRLAEDLPSLPADASAQVKLFKQSTDGKEESATTVPLVRNAKRAHLLEAQVRDLPPGKYRMELDIPSLRDKLAEPSTEPPSKVRHDLFTVLPPEEGEMIDLATNWPLLHGLAEETRGRVFTVPTAESLLDLLARQVERKTQRDEQRVWQDEPLVWWTLGIVLTLLTAEWIIRKWAGLP